MNSRLITPIIMAGGTGTRLWPMSREDLPKQFCNIGRDNTLFQDTLTRVNNQLLFNPPVIVCNENHADIITEQAREIGIDPGLIVCEPTGRNTAPAIALGVEASKFPLDHLYVAIPSDHEINDHQMFQQTLTEVRPIVVEQKKIVTLGKVPNYAETGYGYIRSGDVLPKSECSEIREFIEKPAKKEAEMLVQDNSVLWNVGLFFFRGDVLFSELEHLAPDLLLNVRKSVQEGSCQGNILKPDASLFAACENISFDYAVMEKTEHGAVARLKCDWNDLGSWEAMWKTAPLDSHDNSIKGSVLDAGSHGCIISSDGPLVGTCGLQDMIVIANRDAVLVAPRNNAQGVRDLVSVLKQEKHPAIKSHAGETRPWGEFQSLDRDETHQVKRISVNPGGQLSLQYHFHRSEHWIVVKGIATVTVDGAVSKLSPCQQIYIPQGAVHRLENFTADPVEIIEVQYGSYLGEDDIVRVEDVYERNIQEKPQAKQQVA